VTVYGDLTRTLPTRERFARLRTLTDRHALLLEAGELAQALIDREFHERGCDALTPLHRDALALVRAAAEAFCTAGTAMGGTDTPVGRTLDALERHELPEVTVSKVPEGFAFYAVYPELYAMAARAIEGDAQVVGIRTIGVTLGAVVAAATRASSFVSVRPTGHPFHRELAVDEPLPRAPQRLVVDEGPGLSGSSFAAAASHFEDAPLVFFPSHGNGPGSQADPRWREAFSRARIAYTPFDDFLPELLWRFERHLGRFQAPPRDLSAGAWRDVIGAHDVPVDMTRERRKYLVRADGKEWLLKFAGIAHHGSEKLPKAQRLAERGLTPPVRGFVNGFLIYEWLPGTIATDREAILDTLARHLIALAEETAPSWRSGDAPVQLLERAAAIDPEVRRFAEVARRFTPQSIDGDGRMQPWEWIATERGVLKCDAVDHAYAHDGVGVQDLAWDVAGAAVELALTDDELETLRSRLPRSWPDEVLEFYRACYTKLMRS
jgi:hypothetical protein